jgi:hypothetical protein
VSLLTLGAARGRTVLPVGHDGPEVAQFYPEAVMDTRTTNRPDLDEARDLIPDHPTLQPDSSTPDSPTPDAPKIDLSLTQVLGGSLAAATAAALGSRLGVVGTITGAALVSVVASVAGAVYTTSLRRTKYQMARALGTVSGGRVHSPQQRRPRVRMVLVGAAAVFAVTATGVTGVELLTGTSFNGRSGSTTVSTSLQGDAGGSQQAPAPAPTASPSPTDTPTPSASPSASASASASPTPSVSADPTASGEASPSPTDSSSPSASTSTDPDPSPTVEPTGQLSPTVEPSAPEVTSPVTP